MCFARLQISRVKRPEHRITFYQVVETLNQFDKERLSLYPLEKATIWQVTTAAIINIGAISINA